ncbi:unnamed protein product [Notodromas monacha]|uniref:Secernin-2 n=1 Tax=Notodromas monacha TaxID=399045 RepID=A0A7R9GF03_9CRUS|nr:unnamed protein product [Notodromas monacha]CAG0918817.1 unnamed protein product [Notodromas monacha]
METPKSCDTFVVMGDKTGDGSTIFGKNSDRPNGEVQELVFVAACDHAPGSKLQCTYIEIDQVEHTHGVMLSKPAWMWGAEMGANEHGVCIGNEAVWTKLNSADDKVERLLGMDLLRLGLERGKTAKEAMDVITELLDKYGQGGPCSDVTGLFYFNSFIIADHGEAWVLETAGRSFWAAEKVTEGYRNISNDLTITTKIDASSPELEKQAREEGLWSSDEPFNFRKAFASGSGDIECGDSRYVAGKTLLKELTSTGGFDVRGMMQILRHSESEICRSREHKHPTASSQISVLSKDAKPSVHWFTGTPDPSLSVYKPFAFLEGVSGCDDVVSPKYSDAEDPAKTTPRFAKSVDRRHNLFRAQEQAVSKGVLRPGSDLLEKLKTLEAECVEEVGKLVAEFTPDRSNDLLGIFNDCIEAEIKLYE